MPAAAKRLRQMPNADDARHHADLAGDSARGDTGSGQQDDAGALDVALLGLPRPHPAFERGAGLRIEPDLGCFVSHPELQSRFARRE